MLFRSPNQIKDLKVVTQEMKIWQDEIFAPVLSVVRVKDLTEAINVANASPFANGACLYTNSAKALDRGFFIAPTIFADVNANMRIVRWIRRRLVQVRGNDNTFLDSCLISTGTS